jgi:hypothetical protein
MFNLIEKADRMSSQISITAFNHLKRSILYLVFEHSEEPEVADAQI